MEPRYEPGEVESALAGDLGGRGSLRGGSDPGRRDVRGHAPAAEHLRLADARPCAPALARRHARPLAPDARLQHALPARLRPCGDVHLGRGREGAGEGGEDPEGSRARGIRRVRRGLARALRRHDHDPVPPAGCVARLRAHQVHHGSRLLPRRHALVRPALRQGLDLPRQPDRQLVPALRDGTVRPRARPRQRPTTRSRTSATRSPTGTATSRSRPSARRRSSPTSPSQSIRTTSATATSSAAR